MNYSEIKKYCEEFNATSRLVIDEFLVYYAAEKEKLVPQMDAHLTKYKKVVRKIPESYINFLKSEFIAHRIFREDGYIYKYKNRPEIKNLPKTQYEYLELISLTPWQYCFSEIKNNPAKDFFEMEDVLTGEQYLLFSPGMQATEEESHPKMWFTLNAFNGKCWQTFGLIIPFKNFTVDDLFFFATEMNPEIDSGEKLMNEVSNNPFPFFMLLSAANQPALFSRGHATLFFQSSDDLEQFSTEKFSTHFSIEWNKNVYRIISKAMGEFPHFAIAYYDELTRDLTRTAMTEAGFESLSQDLAEAGYLLEPGADLVVSINMLSAAEEILNKKIELHPYEKLFRSSKVEGDSKETKKLNRFLDLALPFYKSKQEPDIAQLAKQAGIDEKDAVSLWELLKKNANESTDNQ